MIQNQIIILRENVNTLDAVVISAGNLDSGDKARVSVLKQLDIVTTAGSAGNIIAEGLAKSVSRGRLRITEAGRLHVKNKYG